MALLAEVTQMSLAFLLVGATIAYSLVQLVRTGADGNPPDWLTLATGAVIGNYFGQRRHGRRRTDVS